MAVGTGERTDWAETSGERLWGEGRNQDAFELMLGVGCVWCSRWKLGAAGWESAVRGGRGSAWVC